MFPEYVRLSRDVLADTGFLYDEADVLGDKIKGTPCIIGLYSTCK